MKKTEIVEKFGLPGLDELIGGGLAPGSSILMISEGVGTRKRTFSYHLPPPSWDHRHRENGS